MRMDYDLKLRRFFIPYRIAVAGLYKEPVCTGRKIGICSRILVADIVPFLVEAFKHIRIQVLGRSAIAEGSKRKPHALILVRELYAWFRIFAMVKLRRGDHDLRNNAVCPYLIRIECIESVGSTDIYPSV